MMYYAGVKKKCHQETLHFNREAKNRKGLGTPFPLRAQVLSMKVTGAYTIILRNTCKSSQKDPM